MDREDKRKQLIMDFQSTFATESGKRVLENLSKECYENAVTFVRSDSYGSAFNEGKRYVMLHIRRILSLDPYKEKQAKE
jgi:hypothetical protein